MAPPECAVDWRAGLRFYLDLEAVKSAVLDTVRWGRLIAGSPDGGERGRLVEELAAKLGRAVPHWYGARAQPPSAAEVEAAVGRWSG
ncbi:hypothetical protein GCM10020229_15730 [Kitasatospora albolonga]